MPPSSTTESPGIGGKRYSSIAASPRTKNAAGPTWRMALSKASSTVTPTPWAGGNARSSRARVGRDEGLERDPEGVVESADHRQAQASLPVQNLGDATARSEDRHQILGLLAGLFQPEPDRLDRIGLLQREGALLVVLDEQ